MILRLLTCAAVFAFLGWCVEVVFHSVKQHRFVNRGFCSGPVCPIYGCAVGVVYFLFSGFACHILLLFLLCTLLSGAIELFTGFVMDKWFATKWWDYSACRFNLGGYICLRFCLLWGALCTGIVRVLFPAFDFVYSLLPEVLVIVLVGIFYALLAVDTVASVCAALGLKKSLRLLTALSAQLKEGSDLIGEQMHLGTQKVQKQYEKLAEQTAALRARLIRAFPQMQSKKYAEGLDAIRRRLGLKKQDKRQTPDTECEKEK